MRLHALFIGLAWLAAAPAEAQVTPAYLDETIPVEERIEDVLNWMTTEEKVAIIHAQSKFSSAGVPRLGLPEI